MNQILDQQLCDKYPKIFANRHEDMTTTAMCWGFECGDGWFNILDQLCAQIQHHIDWKTAQYNRAARYNQALTKALAGDHAELIDYFTYGDTPEPNTPSAKTLENVAFEIKRNQLRVLPQQVTQVVADQVKEKYGTLRFYYTGGDERISGMVTLAEAMSAVTCEQCGCPAKTRSGGWVRTLCDTHYQQKEAA
jgi:hypothetical protein